MAKIKWDQLGEKKFKTGVDHGVLYPQKMGLIRSDTLGMD